MRGSIPLFWSQVASTTTAKPDIQLNGKDYNYQATKRHYADLL